MNESYYHSRKLRGRDPYPNCHCHHCNKEHKRIHEGNKNSTSNTNTFNPVFNPSITVNISPEYTPAPIGVETVQYLTLAEEGKKVYTNNDALKQYGSSDILDPDNVSTLNLFVNGVLQPPSIYTVEEGILHLKSSDLPPKDAPITLLFVTIKG
ncbi:DUF4183 domain-containing protein [Oceanobacillus jeddahense]|uniref:DUF4183 domain-containing protein n=1 Tax=Oceanobacillus jeddahense TaxID=1462527 RepID=A0ABY5JVF4_9BACI|nr:DUF4183 domain-containing protein [Oceanobacillus jeddahense]UUI04338.1 DUF4183 domain-containing protein [Oceanobacillus jeddahense]